MERGPRAQDTRALQLALYAMLGPVTAPLVDGQRLGAFTVCLNRTINVTDTTITLRNFDRLPSMFWAIRNQPGGVLYEGTNHGSDWSPTQIVLRATVGGKYGFLVG